MWNEATKDAVAALLFVGGLILAYGIETLLGAIAWGSP